MNIRPQILQKTLKILVISLAGAGDTLMGTPLLRELNRAFPDAVIDVLTMQGAVARDILTGNPCVNEILHHDFYHESRFRSVQFCLGLRNRRYDVSFTLMPQNRWEYNAITWLIGARQRVGFDFALRYGSLSRLFLTDRVPERPELHLVDNNLRLLSEGLLGRQLSGNHHRLEIHVPEMAREKAAAFGAALDAGHRRIIGMHPGSGQTKNLVLRRWAPEKWAELIKALSCDGDARIVLFGSPDEDGLRQEIRKRADVADNVLVEAPQGTILETAALMAKMDAFVCCDTLLTHIAAAMQVPTVVIMGPTPHTSVYPWQCRHEIVRTGIFCSPCYGYSRMGIRCTHPVHFACLKGVTPKLVQAAVERLLGGGAE